jgi:hypothetical protein
MHNLDSNLLTYLTKKSRFSKSELNGHRVRFSTSIAGEEINFVGFFQVRRFVDGEIIYIKIDKPLTIKSREVNITCYPLTHEESKYIERVSDPDYEFACFVPDIKHHGYFQMA